MTVFDSVKSHLHHALARRHDQLDMRSFKPSMLKYSYLLGCWLYILGCTPQACSVTAAAASALHLSHHLAPLQETTWEVQAQALLQSCC